MKDKATTVLLTAILVTSLWVGMTPLASAQNVRVSIGSGNAREGETTVVSLMIYNVANMGAARVNLTYDESAVNVTNVSGSQFDQPPNLYTRGPGWVLLQAGQFMTGLDGDVLMCDVTLEAVGAEGETSPLDLTDVVLEDMAMNPIAVDAVINGTFTVVDETAAVVTPAPMPTLSPTTPPAGTPEPGIVTPTPAATPTETQLPAETPMWTKKPMIPGFGIFAAIIAISLLAVYLCLGLRRRKK
jgi:hypothetical protein